MTDLDTALRLRLAAAQAATRKYDAVINGEHEGRMHGLYQACGASRTGRWAHRRLQPGNLKRPAYGVDNTHVAESVLDGSFRLWYGGRDALETLGGAIRTVIAAPPGKRLVVSDLSNIESRVLGWLSGDPRLHGVFKQGLDPYKAFAVEWLKIPYDEVDKKTRNLCKPPALGCGYGLGKVGLVTYAESMGVEMDESTAQSAVTAFRETYYRIPRLWRQMEQGFVEAVLSQSTYGPWSMEGRMLTLRLPSGRKLYYDKPELHPELSHMGQNQFTNQWMRLKTYGAKLVENATQAVARDILAYGMMRYTQEGGSVVGHVHDECIAEEDEDRAEEMLDLLNRCLCEVPPWGEGLILEAEGYVAQRYRKG